MAGAGQSGFDWHEETQVSMIDDDMNDMNDTVESVYDEDDPMYQAWLQGLYNQTMRRMARQRQAAKEKAARKRSRTTIASSSKTRRELFR